MLGILFFIFLFRALFWGFCGWGWGGRWRYDDGRYEEWHRRAHERMQDHRTPATPNA